MDNCAEQEDFIFLADAKRLTQILRHLMQNAIKFSSKGAIKLSAFPIRGEWIIFQVADEGIGMEEEDFKWIFQGFHQLDNSSTKRYGGLGVGLDLVKRLVERMDGQIFVESRKGQGSVFTIQLLWKRPVEGAPFTVASHDTREEIQGKNFLLEEDEPDV